MRFPRSCGVIVHPTSFPSPFGMGDMGPAARTFVDFLEDTGQTIWQLLPLSPVGHGNSPYTSYSAFAGNEYLISPEILRDKGLLTDQQLARVRLPVQTSADYENAYTRKRQLLMAAGSRFYESRDPQEEHRLKAFIEENSFWLNDYVLFAVISRHHNRLPWNRWEKDLARREPDRLKALKKEYEGEFRQEIWMQFEFYNQWASLKEYANEKGVRIVGDIPIFVDHNSADVWANPRYFAVNEQGDRQVIAGVPPDYFSETGQLWGNPVYRWEELKNDGYRWWIERFRQMFHLFDAIRVDHFRGFEASWHVSADQKNAISGNWVKGPGGDLFTSVGRELGKLPIIAEDLGVITPEVEELRDQFRFPGMKILQFAFESDSGNPFLPHNYRRNCVVYSGTHDNDTTIGWYRSAPEHERHRLRIYTRSDCSHPNRELIRLAMLSVADQAVFPLQDYMDLDGSHRMNTPGTVERNWEWRYTPDMLDRIDRNRIRNLIQLSNRRADKNGSWEALQIQDFENPIT